MIYVRVGFHTDPYKNLKILDLCTGSGAIGISIANNISGCKVTLSDISKEALEVTKKNCIKNKVEDRVNIILSDLFESIDENNKFDMIVSNPPYIKTDVIKTLYKEVQNEPILALDGGEDGLKIYRRIINEAYNFLNDDGYLCLEIGYDQKQEVINLIQQVGKYTNIYSKKDLASNDRIIICNNKEN